MQQMVQSPAAQHTPPHQMQQQQQQLRAPTPRQMEKMKREAEEHEQQELASLLECPSPRDPLSPARISEERQKSICSTIDQVVDKVLGAARNGDAATTAAGPGKGEWSLTV